MPFVDLYAVLAVGPDASTKEIHESWKRLQKAVHPDVAGAYAETASRLLNEARTVLGSKHDRAAFDLDRADWLRRGGTDDEMFSVYDAAPLSAWSGPRGAANDSRRDDPYGSKNVDTSFAVFVDESRCIGCVQCATAAPNTFRIETRFGRARVVDQWADGPDAVADAVELCPVRCIHFVDPVSDLPILERVSGRLWKERGDGPGGISAKRNEGDASPFEVVDALRRRADTKTGLAPWPSRRRRASVLSKKPKTFYDAGADVDTSSAAAAVAAAVRAANAAEAAAAETSDWRAGSFEEPSMDEDDDANANKNVAGDTSIVFVDSPENVSASASRNAANNVVGFGGTSSETSKREVERLHALLRDAKSASDVSSATGGDGDSSADVRFFHSETDLFWKAPDASSRVRDGADASFEASEDGDFAPSEWIRRVRRSRGREAGNRGEGEEGASSDGRGKKTNGAQTNASFAATKEKKKTVERAAATLPEGFLARLATAFSFAAIGVVIGVAASMDVEVVVSGTASGVSATGGWVGETTRTVVARQNQNGAPEELGAFFFDESRWTQVACATAAWYAALGALAETADAVAKRRK